MKKLLFILPILFSANAYANSSIDTVKKIVALAESGNIFNLTKNAESLNLKDEIDKAIYKPLADGIVLHTIFQSIHIKGFNPFLIMCLLVGLAIMI